MECNRDEAVRAKEIAERKFEAKDIKGAKKFALKARNLYPELEGISQMLMALDIYLSAEDKKMQEECDWYGVLGVNPFADVETIRKQYRKLALLLHPDKNRFIGAEGAFQLLSQAWNLLSDKSKRIAYDRRYGVVFQQRNQSMKVDPSPPMQNGFYKFAKTVASQPRGPNCNSNKMNRIPKDNSGNRNKVPKDNFHRRDGVTKGNNTIKRDHSSAPSPFLKERHTFWTVCDRCRMQYEYLRVYLNHHLLCPNCHEAYLAIEIEPPSSRGSKRSSSQTANSKLWKYTSYQGSNSLRNSSAPTHTGTPGFSHNNESNHSNFHWAPFSESTGSATAFQAANMVKQAYEKVKKERQKAQAATRRGETLRGKNIASKRPVGSEISGHSDAVKRRKGVDSFDKSMETTKHEICETANIRVTDFSAVKQDILKKHTSNQLLMEKGREEILKRLNEPVPGNMMNPVAEEVSKNTKEKNYLAHTNNGSCMRAAKLYKPIETNSRVRLNKLCSSTSGPSGEQVDQMLVNVPDPDFHGFDKDRTEQCFRDNQVWAVYDDDDGMPRHYIMIHSVISLDPFKIRLSWLNSVTNYGLGLVNWFLNGSSRTCGEFRTGRLDICTSLDCFSHKVRFVKCTPEIIQIYPRRGDIWALYRNWSSDWNELTADEVIHKYDLVEVLEDYVEEYGVIVVPLVKVSGSKAVFHQHFNPDKIHRIPMEEMSRFSHQVPSNLLTGKEGAKVLKGCCELDPASIPLEILQALSEVEGNNSLETEKDSESVKDVDCDGNADINMVDGEVSQIKQTELLSKNEE